MDKLYYGSPNKGLKVIKRTAFGNGKELLFATDNRLVALLLTQNHNDYIYNISFDEQSNKVIITERYANALDEIFKDHKGYIYHLNAKNFAPSNGSFYLNYVSTKDENVIDCEKIDNCLDELFKYEKSGHLEIYKYPKRPSTIPWNDEDLLSITKYYIENSNNVKGLLEYISNKHPRLKEDFEKLTLRFTNISLISEDIRNLAKFYETVFKLKLEYNDTHISFSLGQLQISLYAKKVIEEDMGCELKHLQGDGKVILSFNTGNVDVEYERLNELGFIDFINEPKTFPWGTRSFHFRDPDGNIICMRNWNIEE